MSTCQTDTTSKEIINIKCCICLEENCIREADKYCVDCEQYYCTPCSRIHTMFRFMNNHKLLDKADFQSLGPKRSLLSLPTRCSEHPTEAIYLYCKLHDEVVCASCFALKHSLCEQIGIIYNTTDLVALEKKITDMQEIKTVKQQKLKQLKKDFDNNIQSVRSYRQELQSQLEKMERETIRELKKEFDRVESCLTREINEVNTLINEMIVALSKSSELNQSLKCFSFKIFKKAEDLKTDYETVNFTADQSIKSLLQVHRVLGEASSFTHRISKQKDGLYKVKQRREIDVKQLNDTFHSQILSTCITEDGSILLTDWNNKKLKRLNIAIDTVTDYIVLQAPPIDVCLISKTDAAVTLNNYSVQFLSIRNKLHATRTLTLNHYCQGLAFKDNTLFISDRKKTVYIHDMNGKILQTVSTDASGKEIFQNIRHISACGVGDRVFVADESMGLVILDHQGTYLTTLTDSSLSGTQDMCTDGRNLFLCGYSSDNIVQIGQNYKLLGEIGKVKYPLSMCFDPYKTRLMVTSKGTNSITVLELE